MVEPQCNVSISRNDEGVITSILIVLGDNAIELSRSEAEVIFVQLGHVLQDMDIELGGQNDVPKPISETAKETAIYPRNKAIEYLTLGLTGEAGEIANKVKKVIRDNGNKPMSKGTKELISAELGDVLWYVAMLADELGTSLDDIADNNLCKLADRRARNKLGGSGDER